MVDIDFADLKPIVQKDFENSLVTITYSPKYVRLMDIFRAVIDVAEISDRVISLTEQILELNSANYTVWHYRRKCLFELNKDLDMELNYLDSFSDTNPKNYQIWFHRRAIVEKMGHSNREKDFCRNVFLYDAKNYHCWAHRQWVVSTYHLWEGELEYVNELIEDDARNNSAWNHRWYIYHYNPTKSLTPDLLLQEIQYTIQSIQYLQYNDSSWNYIRGIYEYHMIETAYVIKSWCKQFLSQPYIKNITIDINNYINDVNTRDRDTNNNEGNTDNLTIKNKNIHGLSLLATIYENEETIDSYNNAIYLYDILVVEDTIRQKAWMTKLKQCNMKILQLLS